MAQKNKKVSLAEKYRRSLRKAGLYDQRHMTDAELLAAIDDQKFYPLSEAIADHISNTDGERRSGNS